MNVLPLLGAIRSALEFHVMRTPLRTGTLMLIVLGILIPVCLFFVPPPFFPKDTLVSIPEDAPFSVVARTLEEERVVSSAFLLRVVARLSHADRFVHAGRYLFETPESMLGVLSRLVNGEHGIPSVRVTFPEGTSVREMGVILAGALVEFNQDRWMSISRTQEGYLFPDTYDFYKDTSEEDIAKRMRENFTARTKWLQEEALQAGIDFSDIVTMASLIEKEADTEEDRHLVSGILWSRIEEGVALQVDATFGYIRGISRYVPNGDDPELESPYNTYLNRELPPGPITNPGLDALDAALHPTETDYFYYLTGNDGKMYYAKSFEEHKRNREKYLD